MSNYGMIPARLQSSRLPKKLLLECAGRPLIQYTWEAACRARTLDEIIIATDSTEIAWTARRFGARVELTGEHPSGTDRIAEVVRRRCHDADIIVNIQGDEPEIEPAQIDQLVTGLQRHGEAEMATLCTPIHDEEMVCDPGCVKVVCGADSRALYFSRLPIPFCRDRSIAEVLAGSNDDGSGDSPWNLHIGIYAYRRNFLLRLAELPPSRLEQLEKLEQLRALEAGAAIHVERVNHRSVGIDTPDDYARFLDRMRKAA